MLVHPGLEMDCDSSVAGLLHMHSAQPTSATQMSGCVPVISAIVPATCSWGNEQVPVFCSLAWALPINQVFSR